jgi:hypothetical protein
MTLRIFQEETESEMIIALHGRLSSAEVEEVVRLAEARGKPLRIDLGSLVGADAPGLRTLRKLQGGGARLSGASPFVALMLERTPVDDGPPDTDSHPIPEAAPRVAPPETDPRRSKKS